MARRLLATKSVRSDEFTAGLMWLAAGVGSSQHRQQQHVARSQHRAAVSAAAAAVAAAAAAAAAAQVLSIKYHHDSK